MQLKKVLNRVFMGFRSAEYACGRTLETYAAALGQIGRGKKA